MFQITLISVLATTKAAWMRVTHDHVNTVLIVCHCTITMIINANARIAGRNLGRIANLVRPMLLWFARFVLFL